MSQKPVEEKVSSGTQWHEQGFRTPIATRNMTQQEIRDFCVVLSHSYKCPPQDISFAFRKVEGEGDIGDSDDVIMLVFIHSFIHYDEEQGIQIPKKRIIQRFLQTVPNSTKEDVAKSRQNAARRPQRRPVNSGIPSFEDFQIRGNDNGIVPTKRLYIKK